MKIKSLHQDNHTKLLWHSKTFLKNIGENNTLLSSLNTYTEYFINGILQHCKHIVRLNVHVWSGSLWGGSTVHPFNLIYFIAVWLIFGQTLYWICLELIRCVFTTGLWFLQSCINICKQAGRSSAADLASCVGSLKIYWNTW